MIGIEIKGGSGNKFTNTTINSEKGVVIDGVEVTKDNIDDLKSKGIIGSQVTLSDVKVNGVNLK
ncbi:hypothetical protein [Psychrobacter sp.]|uniref:hypothetical protein n=1 Tax=Psychrobacter sp. TaxID=56811 RepID=UPI003561AE93